MGSHNWKTFAKGENVPTTNINYWLDIRELSSDPDTSAWGTSEKGRLWFNTTINKYRYWDGTQILTIPGAAGGGETSNSGTASGRSPITVAHGLGGSPSEVFLTPYAVQPYAFAYNKDATNIYIYHNAAGSLTFSWRAQL